MKIASLVARILIGLVFTFFGIFTFFMGPPPPLPGVAGDLNAAFYHSHWNLVVAFAQLVAGVLLLINRYVPVALIILAGFLYNSLAFHSLALPAVLPLPITVLVLWFLVAWPYRSAFATLFNTTK